LPQSKLVKVHPGECPFAPAPLDEFSLWNGVRKFDRVQGLIDPRSFQYIFYYLDRLFPFLSLKSEIATDLEIDDALNDPDHASKASGFPCDLLGHGTKLDAYNYFGRETLEAYYQGNTSVVGCTLKDELRLIGKDARLFRPQDVCSYIEGSRLFYHQNQYLMSQPLTTPLFVKFTSPGPDIVIARKDLDVHSPNTYGADGSQWDARFPLCVAQMICHWRSKCFDAKRVQTYYRMMYNGFTSVCGWLYNLVGQPSGHYNTTIDNCLCHCILMAYHAWLSGLSVLEFMDQVKYKCCGDDIIWSDTSGKFSPVDLSKTYYSVGVCLEFESLEPTKGPIFVGSVPCTRLYNGTNVQGYVNRWEKAYSSSLYSRRKATPIQRLAKLCSLASCMFFDVDKFRVLRALFDETLARYVDSGAVSLTDPDVGGFVASLNIDRLMARYTGWEKFFNSAHLNRTAVRFKSRCLPR